MPRRRIRTPSRKSAHRPSSVNGAHAFGVDRSMFESNFPLDGSARAIRSYGTPSPPATRPPKRQCCSAARRSASTGWLKVSKRYRNRHSIGGGSSRSGAPIGEERPIAVMTAKVCRQPDIDMATCEARALSFCLANSKWRRSALAIPGCSPMTVSGRRDFHRLAIPAYSPQKSEQPATLWPE